MPARRLVVAAVVLAAAGIGACQAYNMEGVEPQTVVAVESGGTFVGSKPPVLLIVQDRSGSMDTCFGNQPAGPGEACGPDSNSDGAPDTPMRSRMDVAQSVMRAAIGAHLDDVLYGLTIYGVGNTGCGTAQTVIPPAESTGGQIQDAYASFPDIERPKGGTPTTGALQEAYNQLVNADGSVKRADRANYVVLITDGLMNCNGNHAMPCICSQENGCGTTGFAQEGTLSTPQLCLDDAESITAVAQLNAAGVKTFVIGLGESFGSTVDRLGVDTLNRLAEAGGIPRDDPDIKFYSAADQDQLQTSINAIIESITAPCEYDLDGPVCEGRLVAIHMKIDGMDVATQCNRELAGESWYFQGSATHIKFSDALCGRLQSAGSVEVSIRGVETACPDGVTPDCSLAEP